jgi:hypothetical protein
MSKFTGGNKAVSPTESSYNYFLNTHTKLSSSKEPFSYNLESDAVSDIIEASSTKNGVFLCLLLQKVKDTPPLKISWEIDFFMV